MKTAKSARALRLLFTLALLALLVIGCAVTASADDLVWDLLRDQDAGYEVNRGSWVEETDRDGSTYLQNAGNSGIYIYDTKNILGTYQTFSMEGDFYFEAFPTGIREGKYTPEDRPLSFICWIYNDKDGNYANSNAIRLDSEGYIYTNTTGSSKTDLQLSTGRWYNIRCVFTPKSGQCEMYIDGEKELDFTISAFDPETRVSGAVRYFDAYYSWGAQMKNLLVKTDSDYVIGERTEEAADYIGYQTSKPENGKFSFRAIMGVNDTVYNRIGYEVLLLERDDDGVIHTSTLADRAKVVYETLKDASGKAYNVKELYGYNYAAAIEIKDLPERPTYGSFELVVRPYVLDMNGFRLYGESMILSYARDTDENGFPVLDHKRERFYRVEATDDAQAYNTLDYAHEIFTSDPVLQARNSDVNNREPACASYFKFTLSPELAKAVETASSARLYICIQNLRTTKPEVVVHGTGTEWDETVLNAKNVNALAPTQEYIGESEAQDDLYFSIDIFQYLFESALNDDGSMTVSFRVTQKGYGIDGEVIYLHSKESKQGLVPYIEIVSTLYENPLNFEKYGNDGYEPWGYAEHLVDEWFGGLRDEIWPKDENGNSIYYEIQGLHANGYNATAATGDFTREMPWVQNMWSDTPDNNYTLPVANWKADRFARTLSTLGTSTANAFLTSEYAEHIAEYDVYGGITNAGFTGTATGFFHVESYNGRPYIIDPIGNPYFAVGMNEVNIRGTENQQDYAIREFGSKEAYFKAITEKLQAMGVNTAHVSDTDAVLAVEDGLSVVINFSTVGSYMQSLGRSSLAEGMGDNNNTRCIFEPGFVKEANKIIKRQIDKYGYADNPRVFGYTSDNELPSELNMLDNYLTLDPLSDNTNAFSYATAWTWLARRMNDPYPTLDKYYASPELEAIRLEFQGFWYARYYKVVSEAVKAADPNHMYMGSRANLNCLTEEWIIRAAGHYTDLTTANLYGGMNPKADTINNLYRYTGKPFIVTEFFAKGTDAIDANGYKLANSTGAGILVQTQQDRAEYYEHYTLALLESQACVGWTWYRMRDNDQSLYNWIDQGKTVYMAYVQYGANAAAKTYADKEGKVYAADAVGKVDRIYNGDGIASNQNVNKGVFNSTFDSVVTVYTYDEDGKLLSSQSYIVADPKSENVADGTILGGVEGGTFFIGKSETGTGYTETVLTVYRGTYVAFANSIKMISDHVIGLVNYFDAQ